jgi:hypothetical protein
MPNNRRNPLVYVRTWAVQKVSDLNVFHLNKSSTGSVLHCRCGGDTYGHDCVRVVSAQQIVNYCKMTERIEQCYCIKFCQKLDDTLGTGRPGPTPGLALGPAPATAAPTPAPKIISNDGPSNLVMSIVSWAVVEWLEETVVCSVCAWGSGRASPHTADLRIAMCDTSAVYGRRAEPTYQPERKEV